MEEEAKGGAGSAVEAEAEAEAVAPPIQAAEAEEGADAVVQGMVEAVEEISAMSEFRNAYRKLFCNLSRRIKLLAPMLEELKESKAPIPAKAIETLARLREALDSAKELLRLGNEGSKIFLVLEMDRIMKKFQEITSKLEQALAGISFEELDISDEVREQVELVHAQFRRAKEREDTSDAELYNDLLFVHNKSTESDVDAAILRRLAEKLQLLTISDLKQESLALHEMVIASGGDPGNVIEKMAMLLKKFKDFMQTQDPEMGPPAKLNAFSPNGKSEAPRIPDDFRCPISLDLMKDPVIVATGQTYERGCIEKWLQAGHLTCPKHSKSFLIHL
uniref:RING-type E3 ubiquitin transferase n=1 Tax=Ananas comosus var. bracteatus TaxID=296719 RepID=A0A6V7QU10_ANACO